MNVKPSGSTNFFNQYSKFESLNLLKECALDRTKIFVVQENQVQAFSCMLDEQFSENKFYIQTEKRKLDLDKYYSFCFKILGKIYFFKSHLQQDLRGTYFSSDTYVHELQRRKHTRFDIPDEWFQRCFLYQDTKRDRKIGANIINISWSGIRILVGPQLPEFKLHQQIQISVRLHRRAEFVIRGEIIYMKKNKNTGPVLGVQFIKMSYLLDSKIQNVCEDLLRYNILKQKISHK